MSSVVAEEKAKPSIFEPVLVPHFQGRSVKRFAVSEEFTPHVQINERVRVGDVGILFRAQYYGKIEVDVPVGDLTYHRLGQIQDYIDIYRNLDHQQALIPLAHIRQMIEAQPADQDGPLAISGSSNLFFCLDKGATVGLVFVTACPSMHYWDICGGSQHHPDKFFPGARVFYRSS